MMPEDARQARERLTELGFGQEELEILRGQGFVAPEFRVRAADDGGHVTNCVGDRMAGSACSTWELTRTPLLKFVRHWKRGSSPSD